MLTAPPQRPAAVPSAGLIASLAVWHWIDNTAAGLVAFLLLAHPTPARDDAPAKVPPAMRVLAASLALAECSAPLPDIGPRLYVHGPGVFLRLDGCEYVLRVPIGGRWAEFAGAGGTVAVAVGLDPLPAHSPKDAVAEYMADSARAGRLFMGKTRAQPSAASGRGKGRDEH